MKNKKKIIFIGSVFIVLIILINVSLSKYVFDRGDSRYFESTSFYFTTNLIDNNEMSSYKIENWDGEHEKKIKFDIKNYLNNLTRTDSDIKYKLKAELTEGNSSLLAISVKDENDLIVDSNTELTLSGSTYNFNNYYIDITTDNKITKGESFKIKLTMSSTEPYKKELVTEIKLNVSNVGDFIYEIIDSNNEEYLILKIQINNNIKDLTVTYDDTNLLIDKSNKFVNLLNVTSNSFVIPKEKLEVNKTYEIDFIKINGIDGNITVE